MLIASIGGILSQILLLAWVSPDPHFELAPWLYFALALSGGVILALIFNSDTHPCSDRDAQPTHPHSSDNLSSSPGALHLELFLWFWRSSSIALEVGLHCNLHYMPVHCECQCWCQYRNQCDRCRCQCHFSVSVSASACSSRLLLLDTYDFFVAQANGQFTRPVSGRSMT